MKNDKFIKVTLVTANLVCYINAMVICAITEYSDYRRINTIGGEYYNVTETSQEIFKLIKKTETINFTIQ